MMRALRSFFEPRITRQCRWHTLMAKAWHAKAVLTKAMTADLERPEDQHQYTDNDRGMLKTIDLEKIDGEASPESARDAESQAKLRAGLADAVAQIEATYKGAKADLELRDVGPRLTTAMYTVGIPDALDAALTAPVLTPSSAEARDARSRRSGGTKTATAGGNNGASMPRSVAGVLRRDLPWTLAIALAASALYILTGVFDSTWGTSTTT